jgi:hypothetical protein
MPTHAPRAVPGRCLVFFFYVSAALVAFGAVFAAVAIAAEQGVRVPAVLVRRSGR